MEDKCQWFCNWLCEDCTEEKMKECPNFIPVVNDSKSVKYDNE